MAIGLVYYLRLIATVFAPAESGGVAAPAGGGEAWHTSTETPLSVTIVVTVTLVGALVLSVVPGPLFAALP